MNLPSNSEPVDELISSPSVMANSASFISTLYPEYVLFRAASVLLTYASSIVSSAYELSACALYAVTWFMLLLSTASPYFTTIPIRAHTHTTDVATRIFLFLYLYERMLCLI